MHGGSEEELLEACTQMLEVLDEGKPHSAKSGETSAWRHWLAFCAHRATEPWRNDPSVHTDFRAHEAMVNSVFIPKSARLKSEKSIT